MEEEAKDKYAEKGGTNRVDLTNEEAQIADRARILFNYLDKEALPDPEKMELWSRVGNSLNSGKSAGIGKSFGGAWWFAAAAAVLLLITFSGYYLSQKDSEEEAMKNLAQEVAFSSSETQLLLPDKRKINLKKDNSEVIYKNGGIQIDSLTIVKKDQVVGQEAWSTLVVPYGKRSTITLSDGTRIWVNSGSKLVYPSQFSAGKREVFLEGQAYFSVSHDESSPFYVRTNNMNVKVLGTEFDISSYDDDHQNYAVLTKGSIELVTDKAAIFGGKKNIMVPGTRAVYDPGSNRVSIDKVDVEQYISWKDGYLILKSAPLDGILKKLSRYYRYDLSLKEEGLADEKFSGKLDLQENIEHVIEIIATTTSLTYHKTGRRFILEKGIQTQ